MAKGGRRYPLVIYTRMMNRWWPVVFLIGVVLLAIAWLIQWWGFEQWRWLAAVSIGGLNLFIGVLLLLLRKSAYVQPFSDYMKLVTPFLRLNISYKRFRRASSANMGALFPRESISSWRAEIIEPLVKMTALVIELNSYPMPRSTLRMFLSPFFFKDKTPHFVILVEDWMRFSTELESMRAGGAGSAASSPQQRHANSSILSRLPGRDK